ncbi:protein FAM47E isoform X6 [Bos indicus]|uniref:Protein FAM47E isoform X6 n=1 Tax=Bos indicus TaxID=9915 RepID=A0ABM4SIV0_BOSIN
MADHSRLFPPAPRAGMRVGRTCRPRYRENLPSKCFMEHKGRLPGPTSLDSRWWRFVRTGQDDFRRDCPPCEGLAALGPREGFLPQIYHRAPPPAPKKRHAALCSKLSPAQQARKAFLAAIEAQLTLHPLALYPDLEEDMPTELLLKVLEVLDPDKKLEDTWAYCQGIRKRMKKPTKLLKKRSTQVYLGLQSVLRCHHLLPGLLELLEWLPLVSWPPPSPQPMPCFIRCTVAKVILQNKNQKTPKKSPVSHPCQWLYEKRKPSETGLLQKDGLLLHENIRQGVSDFCNWATAFKPHKPKWVKMRYGAWYLNPKLWKKQRADEPLVDPKVLRKAQDENFKKELQEQEELLVDLHGAVAFKNFILSRGYRMPSFLEKMYMKKECKRECNQRQSYKITQA